MLVVPPAKGRKEDEDEYAKAGCWACFCIQFVCFLIITGTCLCARNLDSLVILV